MTTLVNVPSPQGAADPLDLKTVKYQSEQTQLEVSRVQVVQTAVTIGGASHSIGPPPRCDALSTAEGATPNSF